MKIYKYFVGREGLKTEHTGKFSKLLAIQAQGNGVYAWFEISDDAPMVTVEIISVGTGWEVPDDVMAGRKYFGTVQDSDGFVWHYYVKELAGV